MPWINCVFRLQGTCKVLASKKAAVSTRGMSIHLFMFWVWSHYRREKFCSILRKLKHHLWSMVRTAVCWKLKFSLRLKSSIYNEDNIQNILSASSHRYCLRWLVWMWHRVSHVWVGIQHAALASNSTRYVIIFRKEETFSLWYIKKCIIEICEM